MKPTRFREIATMALMLAGMLVGRLVCAQLTDSPTIIGDNLILRCQQTVSAAVTCDYRLVIPATVDGVTVAYGEQSLSPPQFEAYPLPGTVSAILFLIDTSDPRRRRAVVKGIEHIQAILDSAQPHHVFGLATFDSKLRLRVPIGSPRSALDAALRNIQASGPTTELYRNTLAAVELLGEQPVARRTLVLLSDGQAEDKAYFHHDVIKAALRHGVTIDGLGYPRSIARSVALQTLRRLSEETGGRFVEGTPRFQLLGDYLSSPFDAFDSGGTLDIDLQAAVDNSDSTVESGTIRIELNLSNGTTASADIKVRLRDAKAAPPPVPIAPLIVHVMPEQRYEQVVSASPIPPVQPDSGTALILPSAPEPGMPAPADGVATRPNEPIEPVAPVALTTPDSTPSTAAPTVSVRVEPAALRVPVGGFEFKLADVITYAIAGAGVVLAVLLVVLYRVTLRRRDAKEMAFELSPDAEPGQVFAYLKALDGREDRHPINSAAYRIGRHGDNELPIQDPSMSRHHAQIQRKRDGSFVITDLDSMNGVFVNDKRITRSPLNDGDRVELGDVQMRFAAAVQDELDGDDTMMVTTAMPSAYQMDRGAA